jgi:hypothetical protein
MASDARDIFDKFRLKTRITPSEYMEVNCVYQKNSLPGT